MPRSIQDIPKADIKVAVENFHHSYNSGRIVSYDCPFVLDLCLYVWLETTLSTKLGV